MLHHSRSRLIRHATQLSLVSRKRLFSTKEREKYGTFWEEWQKYTFPAFMGFACLGFLQMRHIWNRDESHNSSGNNASTGTGPSQNSGIVQTSDSFNDCLLYFAENALPYRWMSHLWGKLANLTLPSESLRKLVYGGWAKLYHVNVDEMRYPLAQYDSLAAFFSRPLKNGVRKIDDSQDSVVSPVDGQVVHVKTVEIDGMDECDDVELEQIKGMSYSFKEFVGQYPDGLQRTGKKRLLQTIVIYLGPGEYHHFHSPADLKITQRRHFPGRLVPVRPWAIQGVKSLYCQNERVILNGTWRYGFFSFGAVGALNVGSIDVAFDKDLKTNAGFEKPKFKCSQRDFPIPIQSVKGQPLGSFNMGSTVVLTFETTEPFTFSVKPGQYVKVGERVGSLTSSSSTSSSKYSISAPPWPGEQNNLLALHQLDQLRNQVE